MRLSRRSINLQFWLTTSKLSCPAKFSDISYLPLHVSMHTTLPYLWNLCTYCAEICFVSNNLLSVSFAKVIYLYLYKHVHTRHWCHWRIQGGHGPWPPNALRVFFGPPKCSNFVECKRSSEEQAPPLPTTFSHEMVIISTDGATLLTQQFFCLKVDTHNPSLPLPPKKWLAGSAPDWCCSFINSPPNSSFFFNVLQM